MRWQIKIRDRWRRWFAWYPARVTKREWVWLEWIERQNTGDTGWVCWSYKLPEGKSETLREYVDAAEQDFSKLTPAEQKQWRDDCILRGLGINPRNQAVKYLPVHGRKRKRVR